MDKGWTCDLVPKDLVINRFFLKEKQAIETLESESEIIAGQLAELEEEHSGEEGFFAELDKANKVNVLARLKEIKGDADAKEEAKVLKTYLDLLEQQAETNKNIKEASADLDKKLYAKYPPLTEDEIKTLVVDDKWMATIEKDIHTEMDRISQRLTQRIKELAERYETPLPQQTAEVRELEKKVNAYLEKMGFVQELLKPKEGWVVKKLGEIFSISAGGNLRKDEFSSVKNEKYCYPLYSNALTNAGLYGFCSSFDYDGNCITVTARGTVGFANYRDHKFSAIGRLLILKPIEKLNCFFIAEYINLKFDFANESTGVPQLTAPQISKYEVVLPDYTEQTRIATILSDMDAEISALETKLAKYKQIKQGMMQELLTGKTRLV